MHTITILQHSLFGRMRLGIEMNEIYIHLKQLFLDFHVSRLLYTDYGDTFRNIKIASLCSTFRIKQILEGLSPAITRG